MFKRFSVLLIAIMLIVSCGQKETVIEGDDLTLNTIVSVKDLPDVGPITIKQTQMFSGNIMRSVINIGVTIGGESQEISSVFLINLDEGNIYVINAQNANYMKLSFAEFDQLMSLAQRQSDDSLPDLILSLNDISEKSSDEKEIGTFGTCRPVSFDIMLKSESQPDYLSTLKGEMWLSNSIKNADLFTSFQQKSSSLLNNSMASNSLFFGLAGTVSLDDKIMSQINAAMTGIPVQAVFEMNMPVINKQIKYGISVELTDYNTTNIEPSLLSVPTDYSQVSVQDFMQF